MLDLGVKFICCDIQSSNNEINGISLNNTGEETTTTLTTATETEEEVTTNANPEVTEGETGCNRTFFSFWNLCCNLARLCNNWWIFCKTMTQCCNTCGLSSSSLSN